jgi:hypothetical protein
MIKLSSDLRLVEEFKKSEGLGRVAVMDGNSVMMIAKITAVEF